MKDFRDSVRSVWDNASKPAPEMQTPKGKEARLSNLEDRLEEVENGIDEICAQIKDLDERLSGKYGIEFSSPVPTPIPNSDSSPVQSSSSDPIDPVLEYLTTIDRGIRTLLLDRLSKKKR